MKIICLSLITCALVLAGCSDNSDKANINQTVKHVVADSQLYSRLPADSLAYVRVPNIYGVTTAKDNSLQAAMGSSANIEQIAKLRQAINKNMLSALEMPIKPIANLLLEHLRSSLELAVVSNKAEGTSVAMPVLALQGTFDFVDGAALQQAFVDIAEQLPMLKITPNLTDAGKGLINVGPVNLVYQYDTPSKQLKLFAGMGLKESQIADFSARFVDNPQHPMLALESQVDSSHKGLFAWVSAKNVMSNYAGMIPPQQLSMIQHFGLDGLNALAFGSGTANHKGRSKIIFDGQRKGALALLPSVNNDLNFSTVGKPNGLFTFSSVSGAQLKTIVDNVDKLIGNTDSSFNKIQEGFKGATAIDVVDILDAIGPDHSIFSDQAGEYMAVRIRDKVKFDSLIETLTTKHGWLQDRVAIDNTKVYGLTVPSVIAQSDAGMFKDLPVVFRKFMLNSKTRIYYVIEGDYLVLGHVPQTLLDRAGAKTSIKQWLGDQHQDFSGSVIGAIGEFEQSPRKIYYTYLSLLQAISDVTEANIDIYTFPSASKLALPEAGSYGFKIDSTEQQLAIELSYEVNPLEVFAISPMATIATMGVVAAVALPAYQSYTESIK